RNFIARLVGDRFMQIWIEFFANGLNRLQAAVDQQVLKLFQDQTHPGINRRVLPFRASRFKTELKVIHDGNQFFEQILVGVLDRVLFFPGGTFLEIFEIGLASHGQIAKAVDVGLQTGNRLVRIGWRRGRVFLRRLRVCDWNFFHVLRIAIKVMSSFWGVAPTKFRKSSINRETTGCAPSFALERTASIVRSNPNSFPSLSSASVIPSVRSEE